MPRMMGGARKRVMVTVSMIPAFSDVMHACTSTWRGADVARRAQEAPGYQPKMPSPAICPVIGGHREAVDAFSDAAFFATPGADARRPHPFGAAPASTMIAPAGSDDDNNTPTQRPR